jgi:hypothetical protein
LDLPPGPGAADLQAGASGPEDDEVPAELGLLPLEAHAKALPRRDHQRDGDDPPRDPEQGEGRAPLVGGERVERVREEIAEGHMHLSALRPALSAKDLSIS